MDYSYIKTSSIFNFSFEKNANRMKRMKDAVSNISRNLKGGKGRKIIEMMKKLPEGEKSKPGVIMRALKWTFRDVTPKSLGKATANIAKAPFKAMHMAGKGALYTAGLPGRAKRVFRKAMLEAKGYTPKEIERITSFTQAASMMKGAAEKKPTKAETALTATNLKMIDKPKGMTTQQKWQRKIDEMSAKDRPDGWDYSKPKAKDTSKPKATPAIQLAEKSAAAPLNMPKEHMKRYYEAMKKNKSIWSKVMGNVKAKELLKKMKKQ